MRPNNQGRAGDFGFGHVRNAWKAVIAVLSTFLERAAALQCSDSLLDELINYRWIRQSRRIAKVRHVALGDLAQDPPHDLTAPGLW